jgi:hypothetical protein
METQTTPTAPPSFPGIPALQVMDLDWPEQAGHGMIAVMSNGGDHKQMWDSRNEVEVEAARVTFETLREKGYIAYTVNKEGNKGEIIREFDPAAEKIILSPPMQGG